MEMRRKLTCILISCFLLSGFVTAIADNGFSQNNSYNSLFRDVSKKSWYENYVATVYNLHLMQGTTENTFSPDKLMTTAEAVAIAARIRTLSYKDPQNFKHGEKESWYQVYLDYADAYNLLPDGFSAGNSLVTRKDFAYMIDSALSPSDCPDINTIEDGSIPDVDPASSYNKAVYDLYRGGILTGTDKKGSFHPDRGLTRAEAASILSKASDPSQRSVTELSYSSCSPHPGTKTIRNLLITSLQPVGHTLYVWGGGWNEADTGAGEEAVTIGVSPSWQDFYEKQTSCYDYTKTRFQIHDGLDCTGFIGWAVYNVLETENGRDGYVIRSTNMAKNYADRGWGTYTPAGSVSDWRAGDIMSMQGHVWMVIGTCSDDSVLFLHASPPGVSLCGTTTADGCPTKATTLAETYMKRYYPDWCTKFSSFQKSTNYLTTASQMRWDTDFMKDPDGILQMTPEQILKNLYSET